MDAYIFTPSEFFCQICLDAEDLLKLNGYKVNKLPLSTSDLTLRFGENFFVPQIFIGKQHIGGLDKLKKYLKCE
jgi:glutaredoxin